MYWSAEGTRITLPKVQHAELLDPLTGARQTLNDYNGIRPVVKPSLQILVW
jgi:polysaccharide biosynthesis protein PslG